MARASAKPGKQRVAALRPPSVKRRKMLSAHLSSGLAETYGRRSVPVREGDTVQIARGDYSDISGKVLKVDYGSGRIQVEGATRERVDGRPAIVLVHPSKVVVTRLELGDKLRVRSLERARASRPQEVSTQESAPQSR